jgi:branched-subunit amino acid transport protein
MNWAEVWLIVGMALVTFACRDPIMALVSRVRLPPPLLAALRFVPPAVLTAIIVPAVMAPAGRLVLGVQNPALVAALVCGWVAWRWKNLLLTIGVGMVVWWACEFVLRLR